MSDNLERIVFSHVTTNECCPELNKVVIHIHALYRVRHKITFQIHHAIHWANAIYRCSLRAT